MQIDRVNPQYRSIESSHKTVELQSERVEQQYASRRIGPSVQNDRVEPRENQTIEQESRAAVLIEKNRLTVQIGRVEPRDSRAAERESRAAVLIEKNRPTVQIKRVEPQDS